MIESQAESATGTWSVAECPFTIEYSLRALDDIRLAVMDAFFSLPRGGAEIGGVLLGKRIEGRVAIRDYLALECEHAFGPSFTLSPPDETRLAELLAQPHSGDLQPVGWYHSHTRSEIFLSDADQTIHARFFPEDWQVALVLKPHTFQPMRGGFFFRNADGSMHGAATLQEFTLDAQPMRTLPGGTPGAPPGRSAERRESAKAEEAIDIAPASQAPAIAANGENGHGAAAQTKLEQVAAAAETPEPAQEPEIEAPSFLIAGERRSGVWWKTTVAVTAGLALGVGGYQTRRAWVPRIAEVLDGAPAPAPQADIALSAMDTGGQLQIRWDTHSPAVRQGQGGTMVISDGVALPREIRLDRTHLLAGSFTYAREGTEVDVQLSIDEPGGTQAKDVTGFVGRVPDTPAPTPAPQVVNDSQLRRERDALAAEDARLRTDVVAQREHIKRLERSLAQAQNELKQQQRKRMGAQNPDRR
jgi:proteasome lid subunit RPN8/RPN11